MKFSKIFSFTFFSFCSFLNSLSISIQSRLFFFLVILAYIFFISLRQFHWITSGEMWAEMATNYYDNAISTSLFNNFFATDYGYIPLPQRLISIVPKIFNLPTAYIPYFYNFSSFFLTAIFAGTFCLAPFRKIIPSDLFRFFISVAILINSDFETKTFINFTYYAPFFIATIASLALVTQNEKLPLVSYFAPILVMSKPAVLAVVPLVFLATIFGNKKFRIIGALTIVFSFIQVFQMFVSLKSGLIPSSHAGEFSLFQKFLSIPLNSIGIIAGYFFGPILKNKIILLLVSSTTLLIFTCYRVYKVRSASNILIFSGFSLVFFNMVINCFVLSSEWNIHLSKMSEIPIYRHVIISFHGAVLVLAGLFQNIFSRSDLNKFLKPQFCFLVWFIFSGWLYFGFKTSRQPKFPFIHNSSWQSLSHNLDFNKDQFCIPINPLGWFYGKNCTLLNPGVNIVNWGNDYYSLMVNSSFSMTIPTELESKSIHSFAFIIKKSFNENSLTVNSLLNFKDGTSKKANTIITFYGSTEKLAFIQLDHSFRASDLKTVELSFDKNIEIRVNRLNSNFEPIFLWLGY